MTSTLKNAAIAAAASLTLAAGAQAAEPTTLPASNTIMIETTKGPVTVELWPQVAPKHVEAFKQLTQKGFYDGLVFHRIVPGFVAQTGDPTGTGMGGPGYTLKAEFSDKPHVRGTLAMARAASPDSAGSQFYIVLEDAPHLNGNYTVFGQVTSGMEVVDQLKQNVDKMVKLSFIDAQ